VALDNQAVQTAVSDLRQRHVSAKASCDAARGGRGRVKPKKWRVKKGKSWNFGMVVEVLRPSMTHDRRVDGATWRLLVGLLFPAGSLFLRILQSGR